MLTLIVPCSISAALSTAIDDPISAYFSFTGIVKEITLRVNADGSKGDGSSFVLLESEQNVLTYFIVSNDTYMISEEKLEIGKKATAYYLTNRPVILIYPPQYEAAVMEVNPSANVAVKVDHFNEALVSDDNFLRLNISNTTEIFLTNGRKYTGEIRNKNLIVFYAIATFSIPALTTPLKIIVLNPELNATLDVSKMDIIVNNQKINAPAAYVNSSGVVMVPLRAIAQALGFDVKWDNGTKTVNLGNTISLKIGINYYTYARMAPIELSAAPELVNGITYVPLSFFKEVARQNNAVVFAGQIMIDNYEEIM